MLSNQKGSNEVSKNKATIFADQISTESMRIKYFASLAFIIDNHDLKEELLLKGHLLIGFLKTTKRILMTINISCSKNILLAE